MRDLRRILELRFENHSQREIARMLKVSRNTVRDVFDAADAAGVYWNTAYNLSESQINELLFPSNGIDVSYYQGSIDWNAVKNSGIDFVFVRVGYRGYSNGALKEDPNAAANINGALTAGLKVGVYMFSQAVNADEAAEEARFALSKMSGYNITMPVVMDFEFISGGRGRLYQAGLSKDAATTVVN